MQGNKPLLETRNLTKRYSVRSGNLFTSIFRDEQYLTAVDDVPFQIGEGEIVGLAGQSGCGKSTLGELLLALQNPTSGDILFDGQDITENSSDEMKEFRRRAQFIFQDPYQSLNPRYTVGRTVIEPLKIHDLGGPEEREERAIKALEDAGLGSPQEHLGSLPSELSGGQRQRVAIARALVLDPDFLIADEPVSMLDVSISTGILNRLKQLQQEKNITVLYISHDLGTIKYLTDRTMIMYLGDIVEMGETADLIESPAHPYTESLLAAVPSGDPNKKRGGSNMSASIDDPINLPKGCRFHPHCDYRTEECTEDEPLVEAVSEDRYAACYHPLNE